MTHATAFQPEYAEASASLADLLRIFALIGVVAFGGPAAHVAVMEKELVAGRRWIHRDHFLDLLAATQLLPGPNSTQMTMHIGYVQRGIPGVLVAGLAFIVPAAAITLGFAWLYTNFNELTVVEGMLYGIQPAVLAVIAVALVRLAPQAADVWRTRLVFLAAFAASVSGVNELVVLGVSALAAVIMFGRFGNRGSLTATVLIAPWLTGATTTATEPSRLVDLAVTFFTFGVTLFGSGYLLFAYLQRELVERQAVLSNPQLIDAIMIGELTPGPLFTVSTVIGFFLAGPAGAVVATVAIFLPSFALAILLGRVMPRLKQSAVARHLLRGIGAGVLGIMLAVLVKVSVTLFDTVTQAVLAAVLLTAMLIGRLSALVVIPAAALIGVALTFLT